MRSLRSTRGAADPARSLPSRNRIGNVGYFSNRSKAQASDPKSRGDEDAEYDYARSKHAKP
jgi:hypothetical protein